MNELDGGGWQSQMIGAEGSVPLMYQRESNMRRARASDICIYLYIHLTQPSHDRRS